ncbi:MAG: CBS domain-containing protein [Patescibacteria group bacterium]|nr:CBS domain-containing protein [Patescibacteria group bacterium]
MRLLNLLKENNIIKASLDDSLHTVLKKLSTSHDAAFVFDDKGKFVGLINPYHHLIKNSYPANTRIKNCLFHPPKIHLNYPLTKVVELFIQSKVHYLPVFDNQENFIGIISARRILNYLKTLPIFGVKISEFIKNKRLPIVVNVSDSISKALGIFKKEKISKLIVVSKDNKVKGILSFYDLINLLSFPKSRESRGERIGSKTSYLNKPASDYCKTVFLTVKKDDNLSKVAQLIINKSIGSVVIVDEENRPVNIITTRDLLSHYIIRSKAGFLKKVTSKIKSVLPLKEKPS